MVTQRALFKVKWGTNMGKGLVGKMKGTDGDKGEESSYNALCTCIKLVKN